MHTYKSLAQQYSDAACVLMRSNVSLNISAHLLSKALHMLLLHTAKQKHIVVGPDASLESLWYKLYPHSFSQYKEVLYKFDQYTADVNYESRTSQELTPIQIKQIHQEYVKLCEYILKDIDSFTHENPTSMFESQKRDIKIDLVIKSEIDCFVHFISDIEAGHKVYVTSFDREHPLTPDHFLALQKEILTYGKRNYRPIAVAASSQVPTGWEQSIDPFEPHSMIYFDTLQGLQNIDFHTDDCIFCVPYLDPSALARGASVYFLYPHADGTFGIFSPDYMQVRFWADVRDKLRANYTVIVNHGDREFVATYQQETGILPRTVYANTKTNLLNWLEPKKAQVILYGQVLTSNEVKELSSMGPVAVYDLNDIK